MPAYQKYYLKDKKLSMKAKGLLTIIYSLPDEWDYNMKGLSNITALSLKQLRTILKELEFFRYIERQRSQDEKGRFIYNYYIWIEPMEFNDKEEEELWFELYYNSPYYQKGHTVKGEMDFYL